MLSGCNGVSPWAGTASEGARYLVETALGGYSSGLLCDWGPPYGFDPAAVSCVVPDHPNVWTDGSLVLDKVAGATSGQQCHGTAPTTPSPAMARPPTVPPAAARRGPYAAGWRPVRSWARR